MKRKFVSCILIVVMMIVSIFCFQVGTISTTYAFGAMLRLTKTVDNNRPCPGSTINFVYQVTNIGTVPISNITVQENLIDVISPASVNSLAPGQTAIFNGSLTIPGNAVVGSAISNSAVATGTYCNSTITTMPCSLTFVVGGQATNVQINNNSQGQQVQINNNNNQQIQINNNNNNQQVQVNPTTPTYVIEIPSIPSTPSIPSIPYVPSLPSTGENNEYLFFERLFGM